MPLIFRIVRAGVVAALVAGAAGYAVERVRFGASDQSALDRVQAEIRDRFERSASSLGAIATRVAANPDAGSSAPRDPAGIRRLFDLVAAALPEDSTRRTGVTVCDTAAAPLAWAGRVSDLPKARVQGPAAIFIAPSALGPRLIRVEPVTADGVRVSTVVAEQSLGLTEEAPGLVDTFVMQTSTVPVTLRLGAAGAPAATSPYRFIVPARDSAFVLEAEVAPADLAAARARWRSITWATMLCIVGAALLLSMGPLIDMRRRTRETSRFLTLTAALIVIVVFVRVIVYFALTPIAPTPEPTPLDLFLTTVTMASVVWLVLDLIERRRSARPRPPLLALTSGAMATLAAAYAAAGLGACWLLWGYEGFLKRVVAETTLDLLHFSHDPLTVDRVTLAFALILLHAGAIWLAATVLRLPGVLWRTTRRFTAAGESDLDICRAARAPAGSPAPSQAPRPHAPSGRRCRSARSRLRSEPQASRPSPWPASADGCDGCRSRDGWRSFSSRCSRPPWPCTRRFSRTRPRRRSGWWRPNTDRRRRRFARTCSGGCSRPSSRSTRFRRSPTSSTGRAPTRRRPIPQQSCGRVPISPHTA